MELSQCGVHSISSSRSVALHSLPPPSPHTPSPADRHLSVNVRAFALIAQWSLGAKSHSLNGIDRQRGGWCRHRGRGRGRLQSVQRVLSFIALACFFIVCHFASHCLPLFPPFSLSFSLSLWSSSILFLVRDAHFFALVF